MVVELAMVAVVLVAVGAAVVASQNAQKQAASTASRQAATVATPSTVPNGNVDNAVNAVLQNTTAESANMKQDDQSTPGTDLSNRSATNMEGSYDESAF